MSVKRKGPSKTAELIALIRVIESAKPDGDLSVSFRGSTGFGKNFTNARNLEWRRKMQSYLINAVNWSIQQGLADSKHIAIMGWPSNSPMKKPSGSVE
jgi:hypothetical protein